MLVVLFDLPWQDSQVSQRNHQALADPRGEAPQEIRKVRGLPRFSPCIPLQMFQECIASQMLGVLKICVVLASCKITSRATFLLFLLYIWTTYTSLQTQHRSGRKIRSYLSAEGTRAKNCSRAVPNAGLLPEGASKMRRVVSSKLQGASSCCCGCCEWQAWKFRHSCSWCSKQPAANIRSINRTK